MRGNYLWQCVAQLRPFMDIYVKELHRTNCNDQGVLNVLVRLGKIARVRIWRHEDGIVLSMNVARTFKHNNAYVIHTGDNPKAIRAVKHVVKQAKQKSY